MGLGSGLGLWPFAVPSKNPRWLRLYINRLIMPLYLG